MYGFFMEKTSFIIVDVQNDFCEGGALAVSGGAKVARDITQFLEIRHNAYLQTIASKDNHAPLPSSNMGHFAVNKSPDYIDSWPVHCVEGSYGSDFHKNLHTDYIDFTVFKGYGCPSYSAFEGSTNYKSNLLSLLRSLQIERVDIVGLAYDYCVKSTALDAAHLGFKTRVLKNLTASVDPKKDWLTDIILSKNGVEVVTG